MPQLIVDISSNNRMPDFPRLKKAGVVACFIKATEGTSYVNPELKDAWQFADKAGLIVGSYHFSRQDQGNGPKAEADHYISTMHRLPGHGRHAWRAGNLLPVLDFEVGTPDKRYSPWRDAFQAEIGKTGHRSVLYTYSAFNVWTAPKKGQHYLWIADYNGGSAPHVPANYKRWHLWQYTSNATLPGAHEHLDASKLPPGGRLSTLRCQSDGH